MPKPPTPHVASPVMGSSDPIWKIAFPIYYFLIFGYGLTATITYDFIGIALRGGEVFSPAGRTLQPPTPTTITGSHVMLIVGLLALLATLARGWLADRSRRLGDAMAFSGTILFVLAMSAYSGAIYVEVLHGEIQRLPAVLFPIALTWFPVVAVIALVRTSRLVARAEREANAEVKVETAIDIAPKDPGSAE